ncbi:acyl carrier protein [Bacillus subtilis]|uniref:acyl carrier protein n=1 Tax=Bacillus TaxID=1386 RepID=UPI0002597C5C|nr:MULTISPECIES: acyl carrier protein [Bacillus]AFI27210.1 Phosphopantetheine-binding protein [Bacillus sp. JS]MBO3637047.1 acyl carrier protein [Bacillus subtilis]MCV2517498.1 acyl carrier protein [Bacillus subtilis]QHJ99351.1 hypothetical protein C7M17_02454 [Bacillus subtilis]RNA71753.1 acyl carrier protein [Bacillus subtilis]
MKLEIIEEEINKIVSKILEYSYIYIEKHKDLNIYGLDSKRIIMLIVQLEEHFNIIFDEEELVFENFTRIQSISALLKEILTNRNRKNISNKKNQLTTDRYTKKNKQDSDTSNIYS